MSHISVFTNEPPLNRGKNLIWISAVVFDGSMTGYYDYVLGLIPVALIGVTASLTLVGLSVISALPFGAVAAGTVMAHAMFVRNPVAIDAPAERSFDGDAGERSAVGGSAAGGSSAATAD
jgi:hypothetical protein